MWRLCRVPPSHDPTTRQAGRQGVAKRKTLCTRRVRSSMEVPEDDQERSVPMAGARAWHQHPAVSHRDVRSGALYADGGGGAAALDRRMPERVMLWEIKEPF